MDKSAIQKFTLSAMSQIRPPSPEINEINFQSVCQIFVPSQAVQKVIRQKSYLTNKVPNLSAIKFLHNGVYFGALNGNSQPFGFGKIIKEDNSIFYGQFQNGHVNGKGILINQNGYYYQGDFSQGVINGVGVFNKRDTLIYQGQFVKNKYHGKGKETSTLPGNIYEFQGQYLNGRRLKGKITWTNSQGKNFTYQGAFNSDNQFQGNGVLYSDVGTYKGEFQNGLKHGHGQFQYYHGVLYQGQYKNGVKHGFGSLYNDTGNDVPIESTAQQKIDKYLAFRGNMYNGVPDGKGECWDERSNSLVYCVYQQGQKQPFIQLKM